MRLGVGYTKANKAEQIHPADPPGVFALVVDGGDEIGQVYFATMSDPFKRGPKCIFQTDTGLAAGDHD
jgi:hypothetical protein